LQPLGRGDNRPVGPAACARGMRAARAGIGSGLNAALSELSGGKRPWVGLASVFCVGLVVDEPGQICGGPMVYPMVVI